MLLYISELQKEHLQILHSYSIPVLVDFCKLSIEYLNNGPNVKKYDFIAGKLNISYDKVQNAVYGLVHFLVEGCKYNLSETDYKLSLSIAGFSEEHQEVLVKLYNTKRTVLSDALSKLQQTDSNYQDLEWRFEVQVSSGSIEEEIRPMITMDLLLQKTKRLQNEKVEDPKANYTISPQADSTNGFSLEINNTIDEAKTASQCQNIISHNILQCDLPNLINMTNKLDQALQESKSQHIRKIQRGLQRK